MSGIFEEDEMQYVCTGGKGNENERLKTRKEKVDGSKRTLLLMIERLRSFCLTSSESSKV